MTRIELGIALGGGGVPAPLPRLEELPAQERGGLRPVAVPMTAEERRKVRRRLRLAPDLEIALAFRTGTVLTPGTILFRDHERAFVVEAAAEEVLTIEPATPEEGIRIAHLLGNLHRDIDTSGGGIATLYEEAVEALLRKRGYRVRRELRAFLGRPTGPDAHPAGG